MRFGEAREGVKAFIAQVGRRLLFFLQASRIMGVEKPRAEQVMEYVGRRTADLSRRARLAGGQPEQP